MKPVDTAWRDLRDHLERRARELADEVRAYPSPIARCDDQLPWLIAERSRAIEVARLAADMETKRTALPESEWQARLSQLAWNLYLGDEAGIALHRGLVEALRGRSMPAAAD